jgi:tetratricopeptide (TPR) repeat protein
MSEASKELSDKATILRQEKKFDEALLKAKSAANIDPSSPNAWWEVALCNNELKNTEAALDAFVKTLELREDFAHGWVMYGKVLNAAGKKAEAIEALEKALENNDTKQIALIELMTIYDYDAENKPKFINYLIKYDESYGLTLPHYINALGNHYLAEGNNHLAIFYYKRVFDRPEFPYGRHNAGLAYSQLSQLLNALGNL